MRLFNHILAVVLVSAVTITMAWPRSTACAADPAFQVPSGERQLFLDDVGIAKIENLSRTMHPPAKKGAVIRPDYHSGVTSYQTRSAPMWDRDAKVFRYWLHGAPSDIGNVGPLGTCSYVESKDGLFWTRPNLGQVEYRGSRDNNYPRGSAVYAVYDPKDPDPTRRFKSFTRKGAAGFHLLQPLASDGITWREVGKPFKILVGDEDNFNFDPVEHLFIVTLRHNGGPYGRAVDLATSKDFENWTHHGLMFHADKLDQELGRKNMEARLADPTLSRETGPINPAKCMVDVYNMGVSRYEGLYIGFPAMFHRTGSNGFHLVQLVCSRDMKTWKRLGDRKTFIGPSRMGSGAYDLTQLIGPSRAVVRGDELWFYYTSLKYRKPPKNADRDDGAISLATLRRDGFISLDARENQGTVVTQPFTLKGKGLFVNVDADEGELHVEAVDRDGKVLAASSPITGNLRLARVAWEKGCFAELVGQVASLRFTLSNAQFYSYWLE